MPNYTTTPNMLLTLPTVGAQVSPTWAQELNTSLSVVDQHDHSAGKGVPITPSGLNINADLNIGGNNLLAVNTTVYQSAAGTPAVLSTYSNGTDLYYKNASGTAIQITKNGQVNVSTGNIQGLPSSPVGDAGISWVNSQNTFQLLQDAGTVGANLDVGSLVIRNTGSSPTPTGNYIIVEPPTISSPYTVVLPRASGTAEFVPTGTMLAFGGSSAPAGFLLCNGSAVSRTTYASLFAVIGTAFGSGDGSTTFNLPNTQRQVLMGAGGIQISGPGTAVGDQGGEELHSLVTGELASHNHVINVNDPTHSHGLHYATTVSFGGSSTAAVIDTGQPSAANTTTAVSTGITASSNNTGSGTGHNTVQPSLVVNYIIKY